MCSLVKRAGWMLNSDAMVHACREGRRSTSLRPSQTWALTSWSQMWTLFGESRTARHTIYMLKALMICSVGSLQNVSQCGGPFN